MKAWLTQFWNDAEFFSSIFRKGRTIVSGLIGTLALSIATGQIDLGKFGYWAAPLGFLAAFIVHGRSATMLDQVKAMDSANKAEVVQQLKG